MAVKALNIELVLESKQFSAAMQKVNDAFEKSNKDLEKFGKNLQKIGGVYAGAGAAVSAALGVSVKALANAADVADDTAKRTGLTAQAVQELAYVAKMTGSNLSTVEVALRTMQRNLADTGAESATFKGALEALGLSLDDLRQMSPQKQFDTLSNALAGVDDASQRAGLSMAVFGRSGTALMPMLAEGQSKLAALKQEAHDYGFVMSGEVIEAGTTFNDNLDRLKGALGGLAQQFVAGLLPALNEFVLDVANVVSGVKNWMSENPGLTKTMAALAAGIGAALTVAGGLIAACGAFITLAPALGAAFTVATGPVGVITAAIAALVAGIIVLYNNWDTVSHYLIQSWDTLTLVVLDAIAKQLDGLQSLVDWVPGLGELLRAAMYKVQNAAAQASFDIGQRQIQYEKEKNAQLLQDTEETAKRQADIWRSVGEENVFSKTPTPAIIPVSTAEYEDEGANNSPEIESANRFVEAWNSAFEECEESLLNWQEISANVFGTVKTTLSDSISEMIGQIGSGWSGLYDIIKNFGQMMLQNVVDVLGQIVAEWMMKNLILEGIEKAWAAFKTALGWKTVADETAQRTASTSMQIANDTLEIKSAASVAAARATAASAWSLWGALAIGAAIGLAVMAFVGAFASGGIVPGNSFSGDNVVARVNSGEMILNGAQQARLFDIANGDNPGAASGANAVINQTINVGNGTDLAAITQAIKRGTAQALEFANVAYKAGQKRNKYVG